MTLDEIRLLTPDQVLMVSRLALDKSMWSFRQPTPDSNFDLVWNTGAKFGLTYYDLCFDLRVSKSSNFSYHEHRSGYTVCLEERTNRYLAREVPAKPQSNFRRLASLFNCEVFFATGTGCIDGVYLNCIDENQWPPHVAFLLALYGTISAPECSLFSDLLLRKVIDRHTDV